MLSFTSLSAISLLFASLVSAGISPTSPIAKTTCQGGKACKIQWKEDNQKPLTADFGTVEVGLYVGSRLLQTLLQDFGTIDPTKVTSLNPVIEADSGPDGSDYFVRFQSTSAKDAQGFPLEAFSAKFTLSNMNGSFSKAIQDEIAGIVSVNAPHVVTATGGAAATISNLGAVATGKPGPQSTNADDDSAAGRMGVMLGAGTLVVGAAVAVLL